MFRRSLFAASLIVLIYLFIGCAGSSKTVIDNESVPHFENMKILSVTLINRDVIIFDADGAQYYERYKSKQRVIVGKTVSGKSIVIPLAEVRLARLDDDESKTNVSVFFPTVLIIGLVAAMSH